jgi:hypothetical protein
MLTTVGRQNGNRKMFEDLQSRLSPPGYHFQNFTLHLERTLDDAYYPGLTRKVLERRNKDQIASHGGEDFNVYTANKVVTANGNAPILIVPQLWLWKSGNNIIYAYSMTRRVYSSMEFDYRLEDDHSRETCPEAQLGLIVAFHIDELGKPHFQDGITHLPTLILIENRLVGIMSGVENYVGTNKSGDVNFAKERYFTHVVSDVRSELAMVSYFLEQ